MKLKKDYLKILAAIIAVAALSFVIFSNKGMPKNEELVSTSTESVIAEPTGEAKLSWDANKEPDVIGYRIYYGTEVRTGTCPTGGYPEKVDVGNKTSYTLSKLKNNSTYYFSITSYNKGGKESCFSGEVSKSIK